MNITLVNEDDEVVGFEEKLKVHQRGLLHRAFSILVFNSDGKMLIHQRAFGKYHSPGLWTNACCGHPNEGENILNAANRRLEEEMGFECPLLFQFKFHYKTSFSNGLTENEIDHVFFGEMNGPFEVNTEEVADYQWVQIPTLKTDIMSNPSKYTVWFKEIMTRI